MLATLFLGALIIWIIKDHQDVMAELRTMRDSASPARYKGQYKNLI